MLIGILETGRPPDGLKEQHGTYPDMFVELLKGESPDLEFRYYAAIDGEVPSDVGECDGWLITGSRHGVYERLPWMLKLEELIRGAMRGKVPVTGICFGHQLMAQALGGKVEKSEKGWGVGIHDYELKSRADWMVGAPGHVQLVAMHQDQIIELPKGAEVLASSPFCAYAVLAYDDTGFSIQAHPEFKPDYERELLKLRRGSLIPEPVADKGLKSLDAHKPDARLAARWIGAFFRKHAEARRQAAE